MKTLDTCTKHFTFIVAGKTDTNQFIVNKTETVVTGLIPGTEFKFSVTAENAVSSQDMTINERTAITEGGIL